MPTGLGAKGTSLWLPPSAEALGLPDVRIKRIRCFSNAGDAQGRRGQPMFNQSSNVVVVETEGGLSGIGEGGEPTSMDGYASMLIGQDPFRTDQHWQRTLRGYFYWRRSRSRRSPDGRPVFVRAELIRDVARNEQVDGPGFNFQ